MTGLEIIKPETTKHNLRSIRYRYEIQIETGFEMENFTNRNAHRIVFMTKK